MREATWWWLGLVIAGCSVDPARPGGAVTGGVASGTPFADDDGANEVSDDSFGDASSSDAEAESDDGLPNDAEGGTMPPVDDGKRPVLMFHGFWGEAAEFDVLRDRLIDAGWPASWIYQHDFANGEFGCNADNALQVAALVERALSETGATRVDIIAHSMGSLSTRHYVRELGGLERVNSWISLGGPNHGVMQACASLAVPFFPVDVSSLVDTCAFEELCGTSLFGDCCGLQSPYLTQLNAGDPTPGDIHWVTMMGLDDPSLGPGATDGVVEAWSSTLPGAETLQFPGVQHSGPLGYMERPETQAEIIRVLGYPTLP